MSVEEQESLGIVSKFLHKSTMSYSTKVENWLKCIEYSNSKTEDALSVASYSSCRSSDIEKKLERMFKTNDYESEKNPNKTEKEPSEISGNILDILLTPVYDKNKQSVEMEKNVGSAGRNLLPLFSKSANNCDNVSNIHKYEHKLETPFVTSFIKANLNSEKSTTKNIVTEKISNNQDLSSRTSQQTPESTFPEKELTQKFQGIREDEVLTQRSDSLKKIKRKLFSPENVPYFAAKLNKSRTRENFNESARNEKRTKDNENNETLTLVKKKSYKYEEWRKWPIRKLTIDTHKSIDNHSSSKEILHKRENAKENFDKNHLSNFTEGEKLGTSSFSYNSKEDSTTHSVEKINGSNQQLKKTRNNKEENQDYTEYSHFDTTRDKVNLKTANNEIVDYTVQNEENQANDNNKGKKIQFEKSGDYKTKERKNCPSVKKLTIDTNFKKKFCSQSNQETIEKKKVVPRYKFNKNIEEEIPALLSSFSENFNKESTTHSVETINENDQQLEKTANNKEYISHFDNSGKDKYDIDDYTTVQNEESQTNDNNKDRILKFAKIRRYKTKGRGKWPVKKRIVDTNYEKNLYSRNKQKIKEKKKIMSREYNYCNKNIEEKTSTPSTLFSDNFNNESTTQSLEDVNENNQQMKKITNNKEYIPHSHATLRNKLNNPKTLNNEIDYHTLQNEESQTKDNKKERAVENGANKTKEREKCPVKKLTVDTNFEKNLLKQNNEEIKEKKKVTKEHNFSLKKNIDEEISTPSKSFSGSFNKEISITHSLEKENWNTQQLKKVANSKEENKDYKEYIPHFDATVKDKFRNLNNEIDDYTVQNEESQINNNNQHGIGNGNHKTEEMRSSCPSMKKIIEVNTNFEGNLYNQNTQEIKEKIKVVTPGHNFNKNVEEETSATSTSSSKLFEEPSTSSGIKRKQPIEEVNPNNQKITKLVIDEHNYQKSKTIIKPSKNIQIISKIVIRPSHNKCLCKENDFGKMMVGGFLNFLKHILQYHPDQVNASECVEIYNILKRCFAHN